MLTTLFADAGTWLGYLVDLTILFGALAAAYKFRVFDVLGFKYRSEVWCEAGPLGPGADDPILFVGNYVIHNTGSRPLKISWVNLRLLKLEPDEQGILDSENGVKVAERKFDKDGGTSWFRVGAGERSIYPFRCYLPAIEGTLALECTFGWKHGGKPSEFVWLYDPRLPGTWWSEPTPARPEPWDPLAHPTAQRGRQERS
ncbi:MAG: hypothetical protein PVJ02_15600 [Gemmatimonadota bacterium]|jgi:hypothetical protein